MRVAASAIAALAAAVILGESSAKGADAMCGAASRCEVRPGSLLTGELGDCTAGFLVRDSAGVVYAMTAGHCVAPSASERRTPGGDRVWRLGTGPAFRDAAGRVVGTAAFAAHDGDQNVDVALVSLSRHVRVVPAVPGRGGPCGLKTSVQPGDTLHVYGHGTAVSAASRERQGLATGTQDRHALTAVMPTTSGDSGAPVLTENLEAAGLVAEGGAFVMPDPGVTLLVRVDAMLRRAEHTLRRRLTLLTSTLCPNRL